MKKYLPATLLGVGAFLLALAILLPLYLVPRLAVVPLNQNSKSVVVDPKADFFDVATLKEVTGPIRTTAIVIGDVQASDDASAELGKNAAVWEMGTVTEKADPSMRTSPDEPPITAGTKKFAIDRTTGLALDWSGALADEQPQVFEGLIVKFPFFAEKKDYPYWDGTLAKAFPAAFKGTDTVEGLSVYVYEQDVPKTKFRTQDVTPEMFGLETSGPLTADRYYSNHRTFYVEPTTGVVIKQIEKQDQTLEVPGAEPLVAMHTTSEYDEATIKQNVKDYSSKASLLRMLKSTIPIGAGVVGFLLIAGGLLLTRRAVSVAHRGE